MGANWDCQAEVRRNRQPEAFGFPESGWRKPEARPLVQRLKSVTPVLAITSGAQNSDAIIAIIANFFVYRAAFSPHGYPENGGKDVNNCLPGEALQRNDIS